ncbi:hypothetical protein [Sulfuriferula plumbiphila]|uniref:hypothetical protein n=1 Tax=Sulfuriferula plumbiphila TaxID=171865 RepID=UPI0013866640|nr:hypothetical protein [Sulfuriferula plumbiphila]
MTLLNPPVDEALQLAEPALYRRALLLPIVVPVLTGLVFIVAGYIDPNVKYHSAPGIYASLGIVSFLLGSLMLDN